jgi:hypothetical protein
MPFPMAIEPAARRTPRASLAVRVAGVTCGLVAVAIAVQTWAIGSTGSALGTDLDVVAVAPGELRLDGSGTLLRANRMDPGATPVTSAVRLRNITGTPLRVRIRVLPSTRDLDRVLMLRFTSDGRRVAAGSAGRMRAWSLGSIWLGVRGSAVLRLAAQMRRPAEGLIADVTLEFHASPATAR